MGASHRLTTDFQLMHERMIGYLELSGQARRETPSVARIVAFVIADSLLSITRSDRQKLLAFPV
jgi:hypothetical protein